MGVKEFIFSNKINKQNKQISQIPCWILFAYGETVTVCTNESLFTVYVKDLESRHAALG